MHWASYFGHTKIFSMLIDAGGDTKLLDGMNLTPYDIAVGKNRNDILAVLNNLEDKTSKEEEMEYANKDVDSISNNIHQEDQEGEEFYGLELNADVMDRDIEDGITDEDILELTSNGLSSSLSDCNLSNNGRIDSRSVNYQKHHQRNTSESAIIRKIMSNHIDLGKRKRKQVHVR